MSAVSQITLQSSAAQTLTGVGSAVARPVDAHSSACFELDLTAAATDALDTLDVFVQTTIDGTNWLDVVHFTQAVGNGGAKRFISKIAKQLTTAEFEVATALGAAAVRNIFGDQYRVRWDIVDADADASFTFSVTANFLP